MRAFMDNLGSFHSFWLLLPMNSHAPSFVTRERSAAMTKATFPPHKKFPKKYSRPYMKLSQSFATKDL